MQGTRENTAQASMRAAQQQQAQGRLAEAEQQYRQIINTWPDFHPGWHALALLALGVGKAEQAATLIRHALTLDESIAIYHSNLCEILRQLGRPGEALPAGQRALELEPTSAAAAYNLGLVYADLEDIGPAIDCYRRVLSIDPQHGFAANNLGAMLEKTGDNDAAMQAYTRAVGINPRHAEAQNNLGVLCLQRGDLAAARTAFNHAIEARPDFVEAWYNLSSLERFTADDARVAALKTLEARVEDLPVDSQVRYYFALGKVCEDCGDYDAAFAAYREGNTRQSARGRFNEARAEASLEQIMGLFDRQALSARVKTERHVPTPVFIVGMPRAGTSLIEQILASHAEIHGAGEIATLHEVIGGQARLASGGDLFSPDTPGLDKLDLPAMGAEYLQRVRALHGDAPFVVDKMPANFFYIGFIHMMLPGAKIIHAMREPLDSCFSCYARLFNQTMEFTYDLESLGRYYLRYVKLMRHWLDVLPPNSILNVAYEDLVANIGSQTQRMLDYLGLPMDDACLEFYNNPREVRTASATQVRQPIYNSSVGRWQHFSGQLEPLVNLVGPVRGAFDED